MRRPAVVLVAAMALLAACGDGGGDAGRMRVDDYVMPTPRPLDAEEGIPLADARFRLDAGEVRYDDGALHASAERLTSTVGSGEVDAIDAYGVVVERRDRNGAREWRIVGAELRVRDARIAGGTRSATLLPARLEIERAGRPRLVALVDARASTSADGTVRAVAGVVFGRSTVGLSAALLPSGAWSATIGLEPLSLADAAIFADAIPAHGRARGSLALAGGSGFLRAASDGLVVSTDSSAVRLSGAAARSADGRWTLDDVDIALDPVRPSDWLAWVGTEPPINGAVTGRLRADGDGRAGIAVDGWLRAEEARDARLAGDVDGTIWLEPELRMDLVVESRGLRMADTGPLDLDVRLTGRPDSLAIVGSTRFTRDGGRAHPLPPGLPVRLAERLASAEARVDALLQRDGAGSRLTGTTTVHDSTGRAWLVVRGTAPLGGSGALDVDVRADSLPLALLPAPSAVTGLEGYARMRARATGTLASPVLEADAELVGVRFEVPEYGTGVDSLRTRLRLTGARIELVDVRAFRGQGSLSVTGGVQLGSALDLRDPAAAFEGATVALDASLDTMPLVDMDSARAVVAGNFTIGGALARPHVAGSVAVVDGFVFEGKLAPNPPLDPAHPPYGDLIADAPWPSGRLRAAVALEADAPPDAAPPFTANVTAAIAPAFRIVDEDSDLGARGTIRLVVDERGAFGSGDARIVDGFYAYYGELFQLVGGAFAVEGSHTRLAMSGELRGADRPLGTGQGGSDGLDRRDPPIGIFGYSTPATVLELLRRRSPWPATQPELAGLLLFDVPLQPIDAWDHELGWRGDEPDDLIGHRSAIQGSGLAWSYVADELYDYVPLGRGYLRAGTVRVGSRHPGWIMLGTQLEAGVHVGARVTARATHVVGGETWPGVGLRFALRDEPLDPASRHVELFHEPRFATGLGTAGRRSDFDVRRRTGLRLRWLWDY